MWPVWLQNILPRSQIMTKYSRYVITPPVWLQITDLGPTCLQPEQIVILNAGGITKFWNTGTECLRNDYKIMASLTFGNLVTERLRNNTSDSCVFTELSRLTSGITYQYSVPFGRKTFIIFSECDIYTHIQSRIYHLKPDIEFDASSFLLF
jgi:hypothetical protein